MLDREYERSEALRALLRLPDAPDLVDLRGQPRGYRYTQIRDTKRSADEIKKRLGTAYVERRRHELGTDISAVVSVRRASRANVTELRRRA